MSSCHNGERNGERASLHWFRLSVNERSLDKKRLTEESEHEDSIISYPQLISIFKIISGHKVLILDRRSNREKKERLITEKNVIAAKMDSSRASQSCTLQI